MVNERIALVMVDGEIDDSANNRHHSRQLYRTIQGAADSLMKLCEEGKFEKVKQFLKVSLRLFKAGNAKVRNDSECISHIVAVLEYRKMDNSSGT